MSRSITDSRIEVRDSGIHGRGVYAAKRIRKDSVIIEYTGEVIDAKEADRRYQDNPSTYLFTLDDDRYIDGLADGNEARFINHSCNPNCVAYLEEDDRIVIHALRKIKPGEELTYDYQLTSEGDDSSTDYTCRCGARQCTGTIMGKQKKKGKKPRSNK